MVLKRTIGEVLMWIQEVPRPVLMGTNPSGQSIVLTNLDSTSALPGAELKDRLTVKLLSWLQFS
jgi:hypothetical protein